LEALGRTIKDRWPKFYRGRLRRPCAAAVAIDEIAARNFFRDLGYAFVVKVPDGFHGPPDLQSDSDLPPIPICRQTEEEQNYEQDEEYFPH